MPPSLREVASPKGDDGGSQGHSQRLPIRCADSPRPPSLRSRCAHRLWQSVIPVHPPVSRPSSKSGGSNGGGAPLVVGEGVQRGPPRNRSPLARLCLLSPRCERRSLPQERNVPRPILVPAAADNPPSPVIAKPVRAPAVAIRYPLPAAAISFANSIMPYILSVCNRV